MSGEAVRRRRKKGGKRRREEEEAEDQREEEEVEEPILVTDAAAREDVSGGTYSTLAKSLFLVGILGTVSSPSYIYADYTKRFILKSNCLVCCGIGLGGGEKAGLHQLGTSHFLMPDWQVHLFPTWSLSLVPFICRRCTRRWKPCLNCSGVSGARAAWWS